MTGTPIIFIIHKKVIAIHALTYDTCNIKITGVKIMREQVDGSIKTLIFVKAPVEHCLAHMESSSLGILANSLLKQWRSVES